MAAVRAILEERNNGNGSYYVLKARNGEVMLTSEIFSEKRGCHRSMRRMQQLLGYLVIMKFRSLELR